MIDVQDSYFKYLDQEAYERYIENIAKLKSDLHRLYQNNDGEADIDIIRIREEIRIKTRDLARIKIVSIDDQLEGINLNDVIDITMIYSSEDQEEMTVKLVAQEANLDDDILEISVNSPLGAALYGKQVGDTCSYKVGSNEIMVKINGYHHEQEIGDLSDDVVVLSLTPDQDNI